MLKQCLVAVAGLLASALAAASATYTYTGLNFNIVGAPYTTSGSVTGSFTTSAPLGPNFALADIGPNGTNVVTAWSFDDTVNTYTKANSVPLPQGGTFRVATDGSGNITSFYIQLVGPLPPHAVNDSLHTLTLSNVGFNQSQGTNATACLTLIGTVCATFANASQFGDSTSSGSFAAPAVTSAPTLAKAFGAGSIVVNATTTLTFTLTNPNAGAALTGVAFTDTLPAGIIVATPNGLAGSCGSGTITAVAGSGSVDLSGGTLAGGANCTFSVNVTGTTLGLKVNTTGPVAATESGAGAAATATLDVLATPPPPPPAAAVPAVGAGALGALAGLLALLGLAVAAGRRRR